MLSGENLSFIGEQSGFVQVPTIALGDNKVLLQANEGEYIDIEETGYMYIFCELGVTLVD
jgi:hypothetical protein